MRDTLIPQIHIDPKEIIKAEPTTLYTVTRTIPTPMIVHGKMLNRGGFYIYYQQPHVVTVNGWGPGDAVQAVSRWVDAQLAEMWPFHSAPWRPKNPAKYREVASPTFPEPTFVDLTRSFKSNKGAN